MRDYLLTIMMGLLVMCFLFFMYLFLVDGNFIGRPVKFLSDYQTTQDEYRVGDVVRARVSFCKYRSIPGFN